MARDLAFIAPEPTIKKVGDSDVHFYPLSIYAFVKLKALSKPVAQAMAVLFSNTSEDAGRVIENLFDTQSQVSQKKTRMEAISLDILKFREEQREKAISGLIDAVMEEKNMTTLIEVIADSLRDEFSSPATKEELEAFKKKVDLPTIISLMKGMAEANAGIFGPLTERLRVAMALTSPLSQPQGSPDLKPQNPEGENG